MIKVVLFDLDGTLLPMDQEIFVKTYFGLLANKMQPFGYQPNSLIDTVWKGTDAMVKNNGLKSNEEVFWDFFALVHGENARKDIVNFEKFYVEDFDKVKVSAGFNQRAGETVSYIKSLGLRLVLATNPIFPAIATKKRIKWAGLNENDFEIITTYENSRFCKPNPNYYLDILEKLDVRPQDCLMVGNDVVEDMVAQSLGMQVFLLTDCIINKENKDISIYPHGNFEDLINFIKNKV